MTIAIMPAFAVSVPVGNTSGEQDAAGSVSISKQEAEELLSEKLDEAANVLGDENLDMAMCPMTSVSNEMWKDYGNRYFTGKATVTVGGASVTLGLENHYILSANGIDENFGKDVKDAPVGYIVNAGTPVVTTSTARSVGSSVSMYCNFTCKAGMTTAKYKMNTSVKYLAQNKTDKQVKVGHSWTLTKTS